MVTLSKEFLDKLKTVDIRKFLTSKYNVVFNNINAFDCSCHCPHPDHDDKKPSFSVWLDKNKQWSWCCHGCHCGKLDLKNNKFKNYGSDIIGLVRWLSDYKGSNHVYSFMEAVKIIADYAGITIPNMVYNKVKAIHEKVANGCHKTLKTYYTQALNYLYNRGLDDKDIDEWKIGFNGERISFPLFNKENEVIGFSWRILGTNEYLPKYINSHNSDIFNKSYYLYGVNKVDPCLDYLIITEGCMDVIGAYKYGLKNVVATLGTAFKETHIEVLKKLFPSINNIIFIYDGDAAGDKGLNRAAEIARKSGYLVNYVELPDGADLFDFAMIHKDKLPEVIFSSYLPYYLKEFEDDIKSYDTFIFNLQSKLLTKTTSINQRINNKKEAQLIYSFLRNKFNITKCEGINSA